MLWKFLPKPNQVFLLPRPDQEQQTEKLVTNKLSKLITSELHIKIKNEQFSM